MKSPKFAGDDLKPAALDALLGKAIAVIKGMGPNVEVTAPGLSRKLQISTHEAESLLGKLESEPLCLVSQMQAQRQTPAARAARPSPLLHTS